MASVIKPLFGRGILIKGHAMVSIRCFNHQLSPEHKLIRDTCRNFANKELKPIAAELDRNGKFPRASIDQLSKLGLMGVCVDKDYGGMGCDTLTLALVVEELSRGCASTGVIVSIHNCLYANLLNRCGTNKQKDQYLRQFINGTLGCFALSEPNAGSNPADLQMSARKDGEYWILNGIKSWVTSALEGNALIVFANIDKQKEYKGITAFIVDKHTPGVFIGKKDDLIGIRALTCCNVIFNDVRVHEDNILGGIGNGFKIAMAQLDQARIGISSQALGIAQAALDCAVMYSLQKQAGNQLLADLPAVQNRLAEMVIRLESARLLTWRAALEYDSGKRSSKHSSIAKFASSACANYVADNCVQILGGMGLVKDMPAERHFRDARVTKIYGGATDIQKIVIAAELIKEYSNQSSQ